MVRCQVSVALVLGLVAVTPAQSPVFARDMLPPGFVYLRDINSSIAQDMRYATSDNFTGHPLPGYNAGECILRREAAAALKRVQADLAKENLGLKVYDCYRPTRAVRAMAAWAHDGDDSGTSAFIRTAKAQSVRLGYIAAQSRHSTGTTVDLTLIKLPRGAGAAFDPEARYGPCTGPAAKRAPDNGIDMGTAFDCFDLKSYSASKRHYSRAEPLARHAQRRHAPARLCELFPRMVALLIQRAPIRAPMILRLGLGEDNRSRTTRLQIQR